MKRTEEERSAGSARKIPCARETRGSVKVLKRREKWQTLSCHEALDVFILPQAVLEERSLPVRCSPRRRARARANRDFAKSFKFIRNAGPKDARPLSIGGRLPAASPRNSRNRTLSAMLARSRGSHVNPNCEHSFTRNMFNVILSSSFTCISK